MTAEYLLKKEMEHVFAALMPGNRLVCEVCVETGLRVSDVLGFRTEQLAAQFWIKEQKTKKKRRVNLRKDLLDRLKAQAGEIWVFESPKDKTKHRTRQAVWYDIKRAATAFRLPQNVSTHSLRKSFAVDELLKNKGDLERVRKKLNHSDVSTTMIYAMAKQIYDAKYGDRA